MGPQRLAELGNFDNRLEAREMRPRIAWLITTLIVAYLGLHNVKAFWRTQNSSQPTSLRCEQWHRAFRTRVQSVSACPAAWHHLHFCTL